MPHLPLAYFVTFTTFGTWLHGDLRGSVDPDPNAFDSPPSRRNDALHFAMRNEVAKNPVILTTQQRQQIDDAIREAAGFRAGQSTR